MKKYFPGSLAPLVLLILNGCTTAPASLPDQPFSFENEALFGQRPDLVSEDEIHQLSPAQAEAFLVFYNDPSRDEMHPAQRVAEYIRAHSRTIEYWDITLTAKQVLESGHGNCFAQSVLTTAFAELAGVPTLYRGAGSNSIYLPSGFGSVNVTQVRGTLVEQVPGARTFDPQSIHNDPSMDRRLSIRYPESDAGLLVMLPREDRDADFADAQRSEFYAGVLTRYCLATQGEIQEISYDQYLASFYLGMAADAIGNRAYVDAYWLIRESMEYDADSSDAFNAMALVHQGVGDNAKAEQIYRFGIEHLDGKPGLLQNYQRFLRSQGRNAEAEAL